MDVQAGPVMGGCVLRLGPWAPRSISPASVGRSLRQRSKTSAGAAESRPMISSFGWTMHPPGEPASHKDIGRSGERPALNALGSVCRTRTVLASGHQGVGGVDLPPHLVLLAPQAMQLHLAVEGGGVHQGVLRGEVDEP